MHWRDKLVILLGEGLRAMRANADPRRVVDGALAAAGEVDPRVPEQLVAFVRGPLATTLAAAIGDEAAGQVVSFLELVSDWQDAAAGDGTWPPSDRAVGVSTIPSPRAPLVLVVGLDRRRRSLLSGGLTEAGFAVVIAVDGPEAAKRCAIERPDAVLWDGAIGPPPPRQRVLLVRRPLHVEALVGAVRQLLESAPEAAELPDDTLRTVALARWLDEALASVASASIARILLKRALDRASLATVPHTLDRFVAFLTGPLYDVLAAQLGEDAADSVVSGLQPVVAEVAVTSAVRPLAEVWGEPRNADGNGKKR
jgi:hypothetical protein